MSKKLIKIKVIAGAKIEKLGDVAKDVNGDDVQKIYVNAIRENGKANEAVIDLLAKEFKIKKSAITILKGELSPNKIIEIDV
jgi:uncharacterized protein YggU (UPF0235/DUF167 family)